MFWLEPLVEVATDAGRLGYGPVQAWFAVVLPQAAVDRLLEVAKTHPIHIDLESQTVTTPFQDRFTSFRDRDGSELAAMAGTVLRRIQR